MLIAVWMLFRAGLALSVCCADTSPKGRGFGSPRKVNGFARGSPTRGNGGGRRRCKWLDGWLKGRKH